MSILKGNYKNNTLNGSTGNDQLFGYGGNDILNGDAGNDFLDGGKGADTMAGGAGNDTYVVDNLNDVVTELSAAGTDIIKSSISWVLGANMERLLLDGGYASINGTGNSLVNTIVGNFGNNILDGGAGNDTLDDGGLGFDTLIGGAGNDTLKVGGLGFGDSIDGGKNADTLDIYGINQYFDIGSGIVKNVETIKLAEDSNSTLVVTAQSVLALSTDSDTLKVNAVGENTLVMDAGWIDQGLANGYETFTKGGATLLVNDAIGNIEVIVLPTTYTISDAATAANVGSVFDSGIQEITVDFGGKTYSQPGLTSIDLSGFGLEDKLVIAQHDGQLNLGTAHYHNSGGSRFKYIHESGFSATDRVSWQAGATVANIVSKFAASVPNTFTGSSGTIFTTFNWVTITNSIQVTGIPAGLSDSQFVFV